MASKRWQFGLWHLIAAVVVSAVLLALVRAIRASGIAAIAPIVWASICIVIAHNVSVALLAWIDRDSRPDLLRNWSIVWKALLVWLSEVAVTAVALGLSTGDLGFAVATSLWLGTGFFFCFVGFYEVSRPYAARRPSHASNEFVAQ